MTCLLLLVILLALLISTGAWFATVVLWGIRGTWSLIVLPSLLRSQYAGLFTGSSDSMR